MHAKKLLVTLLTSLVLGGGAWYLNTTGALSAISSSVFGTTFVCSEENLKKQASEYRKTMIQKSKANMYRDELERTIIALRDANKTAEMKQQQKILRTLMRGIGAYNRFIKAYSACQKKIQNVPITPPEEIALPVNPVSVVQDAREIQPPVVVPSIPHTEENPPKNTTTVFIPETTQAPTIAPPDILPEIDTDITQPPTTVPQATTETEVPKTTQFSEDV